ncbi:GbsR/MarR family transcriptional regulator [Vallitalea okinawensis]|uniref:GbsR/MarR family transcriptional regulator n=1 Tax=Vallitalea okinawensis TaxID=2078660 RepID=UPI000CFD4795|nr:hypothetical protein [Vallitalea okinawensis]
MRNEKQLEKAYDLIEEFGLFLEQSGYLPSAARVYALLMVWESSELHFDEIQQLLLLSKGATSKAVNNLIALGRIEVFTKRGIRKKFYRIKTKPGIESTKSFITYLERMKVNLEKIESYKIENQIDGLRLKEEITFFTDLIKHINKLL